VSRSSLGKVLVIDDDPDIRHITRLVLSRLGGLIVGEAATGAEGVELARSFAPDLILLDVMLPGMDGPTTLEALRATAETAAIPVIFLTAKAMPEETSHLNRLGALTVLTKPFDPMTLADDIRVVWTRWKGQLEPGGPAAAT
jgi:CheY-like chemotaxis protein